MSLRMPCAALLGASLLCLAVTTPSGSAGADPLGTSGQNPVAATIDGGTTTRLTHHAALVPRPHGDDPRTLPAGALGQKPRLTAKQKADAAAAAAVADAGSGTVSVSTSSGTWHFGYDNGFWSPSYAPGELNASWSPAGDRYAWSSRSGAVQTDHLTDPITGRTTNYPAGPLGPAQHGAAAWTSNGAAWLSQTHQQDGRPNTYFTQSSTPSLSTYSYIQPTYGPPAHYPLGGEIYSRVALADGASDLVWWPYAQTDWVDPMVPTRMEYQKYRPGNPAAAQAAPEALNGQWPGDPSVQTNMAFLGVDPANPAIGHLYVNHQESFPAKTPMPVADFTAHPECDLPAPAFSPDRRTIWFVTPEGEIGAPCGRTALRTITVGSNGRFDDTDATSALRWWSDFGQPYLSISVRDDRLPLVDAYRISGRDRYDVGVRTSQSFFGDASADAVVVSGGSAYADALAGGPLAGAMNGPVLLTYPTALHSGVSAEIDRVLAPGGTVYVTGGTASVSASVVATLTKPGRKVVRLAGANRYDVAVAIAKEMDRLRGGVPHAAFVAGGTAFADALVAGPAAVHEDGPILLATDAGLNAATLRYLDSVDDESTFQVYGVGGVGSRATTPRPNDVPLTGATRYDVALTVANRFFSGEYYGALADGRNWPDAVSGGAAMSRQDQPILLSNGPNLPPQSAQRFRQSAAAIDMVLAFGGPASVPDAPLWDAADLAGTQTPLWGPDTGQ